MHAGEQAEVLQPVLFTFQEVISLRDGVILSMGFKDSQDRPCVATFVVRGVYVESVNKALNRIRPFPSFSYGEILRHTAIPCTTA